MTTRLERLVFLRTCYFNGTSLACKAPYPKFWESFFGPIPSPGAAYIGSLNNVRLLLWMQPDIEAREPLNQSTLLMAASSGNQLQVARYLLARGADVNARNAYRDTAFMRCAEFSGTEMALLLLEHGAEINARAHRGDSALLAAAKAGKTDLMKLLLDRGADLHACAPGAMDALVWSAARTMPRQLSSCYRTGWRCRQSRDAGAEAGDAQPERANYLS